MSCAVQWVIFGLSITIVVLIIIIMVVGAKAKEQFDDMKAKLDSATATIDRVRAVLDVIENLISGNTRASLVQRLRSIR